MHVTEAALLEGCRSWPPGPCRSASLRRWPRRLVCCGAWCWFAPPGAGNRQGARRCAQNYLSSTAMSTAHALRAQPHTARYGFIRRFIFYEIRNRASRKWRPPAPSSTLSDGAAAREQDAGVFLLVVRHTYTIATKTGSYTTVYWTHVHVA